MSKQTAPLLMINLCCEAIYITAQRLVAQKIPPEKGSQVLNSMVDFIFSASQLRDIFQPKDAPSLLAVRKVMEAMCNCSIMKLNGESMDKLMDLATMGFKYQVICSTKVDQILEITRLHISTIGAIIASQPTSTAAPRVNAALDSLNETFGELSAGELHRMRQTVLGVLQDKRVQVNLLMDTNIQVKKTGAFVLPSPYTPHVGAVTLYGDDGKVQEKTTVYVLGATQLAGCDFFSHPAPLGSNMYGGDQVKLPPPGTSSHVDSHPISVPPARPEAIHYVDVRRDG